MDKKIAALAVLVSCSAARSQALTPAAPRLSPAAEIQWQDDPAGSGVRFAVLWGDAQKGAHGAFVRFPAGMDMPLHHHTAEHKGTVISGTFVVTPEGGSPTELGPGSYLLVPGGSKHSSSCKAGADCVLFGVLSGPDDMIPAAAPARK